MQAYTMCTGAALPSGASPLVNARREAAALPSGASHPAQLKFRTVH